MILFGLIPGISPFFAILANGKIVDFLLDIDKKMLNF